jgi:hypothetical protein
MRPQINASILIAGAITLTTVCNASPIIHRDVLLLPGAQARDAVAATATAVPDPNTTANSTTISYTSSAIATSEPLATTTTTSLAAASSVCFPMMAQVDAINSCGKRYG